MLQITPHMRILVALDSVDGRKGIDGLVRLCQEQLRADPFSGCLFLFRSRRAISIRCLLYDGQGFWLAQKRLSKGRFVWWPNGSEPACTLEAYQAQLLLVAGNPNIPVAPPMAETRLTRNRKAYGPELTSSSCAAGGNQDSPMLSARFFPS